MQVNFSAKANDCQAAWDHLRLGMAVSETDMLDYSHHEYTSVQFYIVGAILLVLTLTTTGGNLLITQAILLVKRLRSPVNLLILNLAVTDLLIGLIVLPLALIYQLKGYWPLSRCMCDLYIVFDVLLCTTSILSLCAISIDRYLSITRPFTYAAKRTTGRILAMIVVCWLAAALISIPPVFILEKEDTPLHCSYSEDLAYQIYATVIAFYLPLFVMLAIYSRIYMIVRRITKNNPSTKCKTGKTVKQSNLHLTRVDSIDRTSHEKHKGLFNPQPSTDFSQQTSGFSSKSLASMFKCRFRTNVSWSLNSFYLCQIRRSMMKDGSDCCPRNPQTVTHTVHSTRHTDSIGSDNYFPECPSRKMSNVSSESVKAVITLGVIMGSFILCWLPFFFCQLIIPIINAFDKSLTNFIPLTVLQVFLWLGYMNSLLNPIIYAKFNRDFRLPFLLILRCQCRNINAIVRRRGFTTQFDFKMSTGQTYASRRQNRRQSQGGRVEAITLPALTHEQIGLGNMRAPLETKTSTSLALCTGGLV